MRDFLLLPGWGGGGHLLISVVHWQELGKITYHVTKNPNKTGERRASIYIGKKTKNKTEKLAKFQNTALRSWFFLQSLG